MKLIYTILVLTRPLPPFDALLAFEAALRRGSMTAAAAELGVTQSAVSHRLRRLEAHIGAVLLERRRTGLRPTPAGAALTNELDAIMAAMAGLRERSRAASAPRRLRVGVGAALAHHWLLRRLPRFAAAHPRSDVELVVLASRAEARAADLDLRLLWSPAAEARASTTGRVLVRERVFPVCHPALLQNLPSGDPASLAALPLLYKEAEGPRGGTVEWAWPTWYERLGLPGQPRAALRVDGIGTAIAAALEGTGVVLARSLLVHDALADGRLARVLDPSWDMPSGKAHTVSWPAARIDDPHAAAFARWVADEAGQTMAEADGERGLGSRGQGGAVRVTTRSVQN